MTIDDLLETWRVNSVVTNELLDACSDDDLELKPGKGKTIRSNFVHIVGVRKMWLDESVRKQAASELELDWKTATRQDVQRCLDLSAELLAAQFRKRGESTKPTKMSNLKFFAYVIAHEAHHRSQIELSLRLNERELSDDKSFALWDWSKK